MIQLLKLKDIKMKGIEIMGVKMKNSIRFVFAVGILSFATGALAQSTAEERSATTPSTRLPTPANNLSKPANSLPMAMPPQVDPNRNLTLDESQRRASQTLQNLEVCNDGDTGCLRRRNEQMRRNTPFQQQTPPTPGAMPSTDNSNSNIRK
jgi:hypothetical protein